MYGWIIEIVIEPGAMHRPLDTAGRTGYLQGRGPHRLPKIERGSGTCPEEIRFTDNAIIPLGERVVDRHYDPLREPVQFVTGRRKG